MVAFPDVPVDTEEFEKLRGTGKRVNFAKNYGAQYDRIKRMFPDLSDELINIINESYYKAFPGVKMYHNYCNKILQHRGYGSNLFGGKYYGTTGHKLKNMSVQGSGAYLLKIKIAELDKYIRDNNLKTVMQMNIHDEISFEQAYGEYEHIKEYKRIMEQYDDALVPIIADVELSKTTWAAKKKVIL
jgi:DNA polymerase I-like protein with 3'-5' exonuclease and polymerase domains